MNTNMLTGPWIWDTMGVTERTHMKYFVMRKFKYIRGFSHDMPEVEKCKNGFDKLEDAVEAKTCLEHLEHRPDMVSFIIVKEVQ
jgi:hypothetical protein